MARKILREWVAGEKTLPEAVTDWLHERTLGEVAVSLGYVLVQAAVVSLLLDAAAGWSAVLISALSSVPWTESVTVLLLGIVTVQLAVLAFDVHRIAERAPPCTARSGLTAARDGIVESTETSKRQRGERRDEFDRSLPEREPPNEDTEP